MFTTPLLSPGHSTLTLGHEAVGVVHEAGSEVREFQPGDRVASDAITPTGGPAWQAVRSSQSRAPLGGWKFSNTKEGVFAEYFHVNEADANMAKIPDGVPGGMGVYCLTCSLPGSWAQTTAVSRPADSGRVRAGAGGADGHRRARLRGAGSAPDTSARENACTSPAFERGVSRGSPGRGPAYGDLSRRDALVGGGNVQAGPRRPGP